MAERKSFLLRIDPQLWTELESWAQSELRSVNGQIEYLLRDAVQRRRGRRGGETQRNQAQAIPPPPSRTPTTPSPPPQQPTNPEAESSAGTGV
ncbi:MAG: hypothetical protein IT581_14580 [Verrucomicrobiales bacterium]|nr:hypothetical protein [Verrucomicrobiales bacterium]